MRLVDSNPSVPVIGQAVTITSCTIPILGEGRCNCNVLTPAPLHFTIEQPQPTCPWCGTSYRLIFPPGLQIGLAVIRPEVKPVD